MPCSLLACYYLGSLPAVASPPCACACACALLVCMCSGMGRAWALVRNLMVGGICAGAWGGRSAFWRPGLPGPLRPWLRVGRRRGAVPLHCVLHCAAGSPQRRQRRCQPPRAGQQRPPAPDLGPQRAARGALPGVRRRGVGCREQEAPRCSSSSAGHGRGQVSRLLPPGPHPGSTTTCWQE